MIRLDVGAKIARPDFRPNHVRAFTHLVIVFALVVLVFVALLLEWLSPDLVAFTAMGFYWLPGFSLYELNFRQRFGPAVTLSVTYFVTMVLTELISINAVDHGERVDPHLLASCGQDRETVG